MISFSSSEYSRWPRGKTSLQTLCGFCSYVRSKYLWWIPYFGPVCLDCCTVLAPVRVLFLVNSNVNWQSLFDLLTYYTFPIHSFNSNRKALTVVVGAHDLRKFQHSKYFRVKCHITHPNFNSKTFENDIMLLKVPTCITFVQNNI